MLADSGATPDDLDGIDAVATRSGDVDLTRKVLYRRIAQTAEPLEQAALFERLADIELERVIERSANRLREGCRTLRAGEYGGGSVRYRRVLATTPNDLEATTRLVRLSEAAKDFAALPELYASLSNHKKTDAEKLPVFVRLAATLSEDLGRASQALAPIARAFGIAPDELGRRRLFEQAADSLRRQPSSPTR